MAQNHQFLSEIHINGPKSRVRRVTAEECPALEVHHVHNVGHAEARTPFERVRRRPDGSFLLACLGGQGAILLDGRWRICRAGWVCLAPPRTLNAFHAIPKYAWQFVWVRYREPPSLPPMVTADSPLRVRANVEPFRHAVCGFLAEMEGDKDTRLLHHWIEIIQDCVVRIARPGRGDEKLRRMWETVAGQLDAHWDLTALAHMAHCSSEHLRRRCLRDLGRTPMEQLTNLRIQRAADLLEKTDDKLEAIAAVVGYGDAVTFSKTFKRWLGVPPSEYRDGRKEG